MAAHNQLGKEGEALAADYLIRNGYILLDTNWKFQKNEIDIVASKDGLVVIVEVKSRQTSRHGDPAEAITIAKQKRLIEAADHYLEHLAYAAEVRFDVISIVFGENGAELTHIKEAFRSIAG
ncbi:MAG: YraN family protein [Bacteroidota bacterium]|nr:MAG: YraN family protein [Bacteroidota bacterium]